MKPAVFDYHRPDSVGEALSLLSGAGRDAKVLAGGQSLVPVLNMRLASPAALVDINRVAELAYVRTDGESVHVGALARHRDVEADADAYAAVPLLRQALRHVAHPTIRNRGTTVGSLVHADPAGEMPAVLTLLDGTVELASARGRRTARAAEFFVGPLESAIEADELAVGASFPRPPARSGSAFHEVSRRRGDYAVVGVGVVVTLDADERVAGARAALISVGPTPVLVDLTDALSDQVLDWQAAAALVRSRIDPEDDVHATAAYRRHLAGVLTARAGSEALERARLAG